MRRHNKERMALINKKNGKKIAGKHKRCKTALSKAVGLMFHRPIDDYALVFEFKKPQRPAMHNLFVFFPIDIICLDRKMTVLETKQEFRAFSIYYRPEKKCSYIIECPAGTVKKADIQKGDVIVEN
ncbi:DUF192 domain-containing protein [Candidatus Woesearchaeota archaeon]|nr:MAG: DUF192 domain-containing protein [Candidatus Woesearchaeota archaeon]